MTKALDEATKLEAIKNMISPVIVLNPKDYKTLRDSLTKKPVFSIKYNGITIKELSYVEEGKFFVYDSHKDNEIQTLPLISNP